MQMPAGGETSDYLSTIDDGNDKKSFNFEEFVNKYRVPLALLLVGLIVAGFGVFVYKKDYIGGANNVEVLKTTTEGEEKEIVVEVAGAVKSAGVYKLNDGDRVEDLLTTAGGLSSNADGGWVDKNVNRAARLMDGQKLYIPAVDEQSFDASANFSEGSEEVLGIQGSGQTKPVNINTASQSELESLWGIGPVYAQNIIEQRPYSTVEELLTRDVIRKNVYERNKEFLVVY